MHIESDPERRRHRLSDDPDFRELSGAAHDAFIAFDDRGVIRTWNTAAARMFGYAREEAIGRDATMLDPVDQFEGSLVARTLDGERIHRVSADGRRKDGSSVAMMVTMLPVDGGQGGIIMARDLTEERLAQATLTEAELRMQEAQELSHVGLWLWDAATDAMQISDELYRIHGLDPDAFDGTMTSYLEHLHAEDRSSFTAALQAALGSPRGLEEEYRIDLPDGSTGWVYSRAESVAGHAGLRGVAQDVTDRKRAAEVLRDQASLLELLRRIAVAANEAADLEQALRSCVLDVCLHTGWPVGQVLFIEDGLVAPSWDVHTTDPSRYGALVDAPPTTAPSLSGSLARALDTGRPVVAPAGGPDGGRWGQAMADAGLGTLIALPIVVGTEPVAVLQFFGQSEPDPTLVTMVWDGANQLGRVAERATSRDELSHQALHDALTGLPNRSLLMDRLARALVRQQRHGNLIMLIFLDLDNFKLINDSLGHETGDDLVINVARRLEEVLRPEDTCARFGGDEFIVLCEGLSSEEEGIDVAERILGVISQPISLRGKHKSVITASAGIAIASGRPITPDTLLRNADLAMYRAKEAGQGQFKLFDSEMHLRASKRLAIANELRAAISGGQLRLLYQPQVETATGLVVGVEALVRWQHPERGLLDPGEFIHVAEETNQIVALGGWVLTEACRQAAEWEAMHPERPPLKLCVNVSPKQLRRVELFDDIAAALAQSGLRASSLYIEITESVLMNDAEFFLEALLGLKTLGVGIAIDDFGTGYSSLAYLCRYPIDVIKVDKGFMDGLAESDPRSTAVVAAVVDLAHALGVVALAEGVETEIQRDALVRMGCDQCQGYYFARPAEPDVIASLLAGEGRLAPWG
ncbi:MAG TPA: EAL domain-containing protein [Acidimicrobiales bacterium]|nr:EAL domain-containing protein [Acidimicrobiales bacterium]